MRIVRPPTACIGSTVCRRRDSRSCPLRPDLRRYATAVFMLALVGRVMADCTLTNLGITPLNELGFIAYSNYAGGLYPNGANTRPPAHEDAGIQIDTNQ